MKKWVGRIGTKYESGYGRSNDGGIYRNKDDGRTGCWLEYGLMLHLQEEKHVKMILVDYCATYSTLWHIVQATIRRKENDAAQSPKGFLLVNLQIQQLDKIRRLQPALCCAGDVQRQLKHATRPCLRKALVQWMVIQEPSSCSKHGY